MHQHDIAISWLMVRLGSIQAGLDTALEQAQRAETQTEHADLQDMIAGHRERIAQVENSIDVLKRDAGVVSDAPAIQTGDVLIGCVVDETQQG